MNLLLLKWWGRHASDVVASIEDAADMVVLKVALFEIELKHHAAEALGALGWLVVGALLATGAVLFTLLGAVWLAWPTPYRTGVIITVPLLLAAAAGAVWGLALRARWEKLSGPLFPRSRAELALDREWIRRWNA